MSRYRIVIQPRAEAEALAAFGWIVGRSPEAAERWLAGLRKTIDKLADRPLLHPLAAEESERLGCRSARPFMGAGAAFIGSCTPSKATW